MDRCISRRTALGMLDLHRWLMVVGFGVVGAVSVAPVPAQEMCGGASYPFPFTDVFGVGAPFCPGIMEAYVTGVSRGTTQTTFSPNETVTRVQMTTFLQRSLDQGLARSSKRAALNQWWTSQNNDAMQTIPVGGPPYSCAADGENIWVPNNSGFVVQVQASTGAQLGVWTGALGGVGVLVAGGNVYIAGGSSPGTLYLLNPRFPPGAVAIAAGNLGDEPGGIAFDGYSIWTANYNGGVSIITPQATTPYPVTTVTTGFTHPYGILYDGANIWVTDAGAGTLLKLDAAGTILQTVTVGSGPQFPVFDGANIWVPNYNDSSITVVQASTGKVVGTTSKDTANPIGAAFDGERVLVSNYGGDSVTLYKAADTSFIGFEFIGTSTGPWGACSDGVNFWVTLNSTNSLLRF